jgi:hypothetical protein
MLPSTAVSFRVLVSKLNDRASVPTGPAVGALPLGQNGNVNWTVSEGRRRLWMKRLSAVTYFVLVNVPTPVTPLKSMESSTMGVVRKSGSSTTFASITAFPEKEMLSVVAPVRESALLD